LNLSTGMFSYTGKSGSKPKIIPFRVSRNLNILIQVNFNMDYILYFYILMTCESYHKYIGNRERTH